MQWNILILSILLTACSQKKLVLVPQWHLLPGEETLDIEASKSKPQYKNQVAIYRYFEKKILDNQSFTLIQEGCEGEINQGFKESYNGWSLDKLKALKNSEQFEHILAPVGLKIKAKYPQQVVVCGDSLQMIKKNQLAMSDLTGYLGFFMRLKSSKNTAKYKEALELLAGQEVKYPLSYVFKNIEESFKRFREYIIFRNKNFYHVADHYPNPIIVIGGVHIEHLNTIAETTFDTQIVRLDGYNQSDENSIDKLGEQIKSYQKDLFTILMVPSGLDPYSFPVKKQIPPHDLSSEEELLELEEIAKKHKIPRSLLLSDFDNDQVRDFTLSTQNGLVYLTAEDDDWDNDGIGNLMDPTVGDFDLKVNIESKVTNKYQLKTSKLEGLKGLTLLGEIDYLVLKVLEMVGYEAKNVVALRNASRKMSYGKNVYFAYVKHTRTIDFYADEFWKYVDKMRVNFKDASDQQFLDGFVLPVLVHSLAHELAHAQPSMSDEEFFKAGWSYKWKKVDSKYLTLKRHPQKVLGKVKTDLLFKGKSFEQWLGEYKSAQFLIDHNLPSLYALKNPNEFQAEIKAIEIFNKLFPMLSASKEKALQTAALLGINPLFKL